MNKFTSIYRTSCAGCDVTVKGSAEKQISNKMKALGGVVGEMTDKSVDIHFDAEWKREDFEDFASRLGAIFD